MAHHMNMNAENEEVMNVMKSLFFLHFCLEMIIADYHNQLFSSHLKVYTKWNHDLHCVAVNSVIMKIVPVTLST